MKLKKLTLAALFSAGVIGIGPLTVEAQEGILFKVQMPGTNYCHLKFPAIREETLASNRPVLQNPNTGEIIDFYGPCDFDPTGKAAVQTQRHDQQRRVSREYND